ncbi:hypothetical protein C8F04DRAFT_1188770 [Mycena alexandri]|uniref:Uncharacterized protein n=1 Tax=Mycena alexandri TaxID=1745969 RepID=A0AAD6SIR3_9AGAR|nr:hypothetical protein C8F04DRAFT_1188770 [Mycena alexandri]
MPYGSPGWVQTGQKSPNPAKKCPDKNAPIPEFWGSSLEVYYQGSSRNWVRVIVDAITVDAINSSNLFDPLLVFFVVYTDMYIHKRLWLLLRDSGDTSEPQ